MPAIRPRKFAHVVYRTRRFDEMIHWYQTVFDAKIQHRDPALAFLTYDDEHHRIAIANLSVLDPDGREMEKQGLIGVDHVAYTHASIDDLLDNYEQLKTQAITPYWCIHHGVTVSMYYADPDGNQMEFQVESFASNDEANAFMSGPGFAVNPIGVEYDPERWLAERKAGGSMSERLHCIAHEPVSPIRGAFSRAQSKPRKQAALEESAPSSPAGQPSG